MLFLVVWLAYELLSVGEIHFLEVNVLASCHRRSHIFQLGGGGAGLRLKKPHPTAGTDPENFGGGDADLN